MSNNTTELIIKPNGRCLRREVLEYELNVNEQAIANATSQSPRIMNHIFSHPERGTVHLAMAGGSCFWTLNLQTLNMTAPFRVIEKILVPNFGSSEMILPMVWEVPRDMRLFLMIQSTQSASPATLINSWMFAMDSGKRFWRLPLPNIYDDCHLCLGKFPVAYDTHQELVNATVAQFDKSQWNSDLLKSLENTQLMFRFKPKDKTFVTEPPEGKWTDWCIKVALAVQENLVV